MSLLQSNTVFQQLNKLKSLTFFVCQVCIIMSVVISNLYIMMHLLTVTHLRFSKIKKRGKDFIFGNFSDGKFNS